MPTASRAHHCPFLNRSDARCAARFSLDHLSDAFDLCAGTYGDCPTYRELLAERRARRGEPTDAGWLARAGRHAADADSGGRPEPARHTPAGRHTHGGPLVPLTLTAAAAARTLAGGPAGGTVGA